MPSTESIISSLKSAYPQFIFEVGEDFHWSYPTKTVYYNPSADNDSAFLLHELSHALLNHAKYSRDIELIAMEREAWDKAKDLAKTHNAQISENLIQDTLDTYRDWLHKRSSCPNCSSIGVQVKQSQYSCVVCLNNWRVNEARTCGLKRYAIK